MTRILAFVLLLLVLGVDPVQAQTSVHTFWGRSGEGPTALVDGMTVVGWNEAGAVVGQSRIRGGGWTIPLDPARVQTVQFSVGGSERTPAYAVRAGAFHRIQINLETPSASTAFPVVGWEPHVVRWGDTISRIARESDTTVDTLLMGNASLTDPNRITVGDTILVPRLGDETLALPVVDVAAPDAPVIAPPQTPQLVDPALEPASSSIPAFQPASGGGSSILPIVGIVGAVAAVTGLVLAVRLRRREPPPAPPLQLSADAVFEVDEGDTAVAVEDGEAALDPVREDEPAAEPADAVAARGSHRETNGHPWLALLLEEASTVSDAASAEPADADAAEQGTGAVEFAETASTDTVAANMEPPLPGRPLASMLFDVEPAAAGPNDSQPGDSQPGDSQPGDSEPGASEPADSESEDERSDDDVTCQAFTRTGRRCANRVVRPDQTLCFVHKRMAARGENLSGDAERAEGEAAGGDRIAQ